MPALQLFCVFDLYNLAAHQPTILFKQTSPQAYILNIEVFHDILTFA
jgi:hypothetical protein